MFDIGWSELLVIGAIMLIVVGPKDLPKMLRTMGQYAGKARAMAREFQRTMEDAAREADLGELRDVQRSMTDFERKIGANPTKKTGLDALMKDDDGAKAPEKGSHDAADAAENGAWRADQAAAAEPASPHAGPPAATGPAAAPPPKTPPETPPSEAAAPPADEAPRSRSA